VRVEGGTILKESAFSSFVNPEREIPWEARQINKISDDDVKHAPNIDVVLPQFLDFARGSLLFAHNATFDMGFLEAEKEFCWGYVELPEAFCTRQLFQGLYPAEFRSNLDVLARKFALPIPDNRHRALDDAILAAQALLKMMEEGKIASLEKLRKLAAVRQLVG